MSMLTPQSQRYLEEFYLRKDGGLTDGEAILGYFLSGNWKGEQELVSADDFEEPNERRLFDAMVRFQSQEASIQPDLVSLASVLRCDSHWTPQKLIWLTENAPLTQNMAHFARRLKNARTAIRIIESSVLLTAALKIDCDPSSALQRHLSDMNTLVTDSVDGKSGIVWLKDAIVSGLTMLEQMMTGHEVSRILTGWKNLDSELPLSRQDMVIIGGRPGMGKTSMVLNMLIQMFRTDRELIGLVVSLEMSTDQLVFKMLGSVGSVKMSLFRNAIDMSEEDMDRLIAAASELNEVAGERLAFSERKKFKVEDLATEISRVRLKAGRCDFVMIDYIGLINSKGKDLYHKMSDISGRIKQIARSENVLMLCLSQLNRKAGQEKRKPEMTDLRDSGSIEQDADSIIFVHHDEYYGNEKAMPGSIPIAQKSGGI